MSNPQISVEKYLTPKEISETLCKEYGLCFSENYIQSVRRKSLRDGERLFISKQARASEVFDWLKAHPDFTRRFNK